MEHHVPGSVGPQPQHPDTRSTHGCGHHGRPIEPGVNSAVSAPRTRAIASTSTPWGVPNSSSKCSGSPSSGPLGRALGQEREDAATVVVDDHDGRRQVWRRAATRALRSCTNDTSPTTSSTGPASAAAAPRAVETTPSMPLTPRLARQRTRVSPVVRNASRSRTGIELPTTTTAPSGRAASSSENTLPSKGSRNPPMTSRMAASARRPASSHPSTHPASAAGCHSAARRVARASARTTGSAWIIVPASSVGSFQPPSSMTSWGAAVCSR